MTEKTRLTTLCKGHSHKLFTVADRAFQYDTGRITVDETGKKVHLHDMITYNASQQIIQYIRNFEAWEVETVNVEHLISRHPQSSTQHPKLHIGSVASSNAIRADNPFNEIRTLARGTIAIDMESAAFSRIAQEFPHIQFLLVKGVSDFADATKSDNYHEYAAAVSAVYALSFTREYVTRQLMPRRNEPPR